MRAQDIKARIAFSFINYQKCTAQNFSLPVSRMRRNTSSYTLSGIQLENYISHRICFFNYKNANCIVFIEMSKLSDLLKILFYVPTSAPPNGGHARPNLFETTEYSIQCMQMGCESRKWLLVLLRLYGLLAAACVSAAVGDALFSNPSLVAALLF